jgi:hypothetical protein
LITSVIDNLVKGVRSSRAKYEFDVWLRGIYRIASKAKWILKKLFIWLIG